jgi:urease gamma subunit
MGFTANQRRFKNLVNADPLGPDGVFAEKGPDRRKLEFMKLNYKQAVEKLTKEMLDQARQSQLGKEAARESNLKSSFVADIAVAKISKNLQVLN